jgi:hypothetical protein
MHVQKTYGSILVDVYEDTTKTEDSTSKKRSHTHIITGEREEALLKKIEITTSTYSGEEISSAVLLCSWAGVRNTGLALSHGRLFICVGQYLVALKCPLLELLWKAEADDGGALEVFDIQVGLIMHGELAIKRIGYDGTILWERYGPDIFATPDNEEVFSVADNQVRACCWDGTTFVWDFNGNPVQA